MVSILPFHGLSIYLSVTFTKGRRCRQDFCCMHTTASCPFPIFPQSDQPSVDLSVGDIRWQIATEWLDIAQWLIGYRECRKATTAPLSNGTITDPLRPPLPSNGSPKCTLQDQRCDVCCHVANIRYRQGSCVLCRMSL